MKSNKELKGIKIKNLLCYYFDDKISLKDPDLDNILLDDTTHENILSDATGYKIWYRVDIIVDDYFAYIKKFYRTKYTQLFHYE